jgi:hypothetical protein
MEGIEMYERLSISEVDPDPESTELTKAMAGSHLAGGDSNGLVPSPFNHSNDENYSDQNIKSTIPHIHPDLEDLTFGPIRRGPGSSTSKLPAPMEPSFRDDDDRDDRLEQNPRRVSLSDFSDYESSDEETHKANAAHAGPSRRNYVTVSDDDDDEEFTTPPSGENKELEDDPFADPFADEQSPRRK